MARQAVAVVGGASGIGFVVARRLVADGARVALMDRSEVALGEAADALRRVGQGTPTVVTQVVDVRDEGDVENGFSAAEDDIGELSGVACTAGIRMPSTPALELEVAAWDDIIAVNLTGTFLVARAAGRRFLERGRGSIVTTSSLSGISARLDRTAYCVSKAGVIHLTRVLALEWAPAGVRINCVVPGPTSTPMMDAAKSTEGHSDLSRVMGESRWRVGIPDGRIATSNDVAAAVEFLLSEHASHIHGQSLVIDGGESLV